LQRAAAWNFAKIAIFAPERALTSQAPRPGNAFGPANGPLEDEADRIANHLVRTADVEAVQGPTSSRGNAFGTGELSGSRGRGELAAAPAIVRQALSMPGRALEHGTRDFFEPRLRRDLGNVRIITDGAAPSAARAVGATAYTLGNKIVFGAGKYEPQTERGKQLIAHELVHVMQQQAASGGAGTIQRACSDPTFCTPYATAAEAASAKSSLISYYLPADFVTFGMESLGLYLRFLSRHPGDSLAPVIFNNPSNELVSSFVDSGDTKDDIDAIIDLVGTRLSRAPGPLSPNTPTIMSVANFLSSAELNDRPINYSNPFSISGHIAGGIGSSDAGPDSRKASGNVTLEKVPLIGSSGYVKVDTYLTYDVFDAVDFCPGDCGSPAEQIVTVPMSRLEAGGQAYDVPFRVTFVPESRTKRFFY
jgi:hypothetical protein